MIKWKNFIYGENRYGGWNKDCVYLDVVVSELYRRIKVGKGEKLFVYVEIEI